MSASGEQALQPAREELPPERPSASELLGPLFSLLLAVGLAFLALESGFALFSIVLLAFALALAVAGGVLLVAALQRWSASAQPGVRLRCERGGWQSGTVVEVLVFDGSAPEDGIPTAVLEVQHGRRSLCAIPLRGDRRAARREGELWGYRLELPLPSDLPTARAQWRLRWRARRGPLSFLLPVAAGSAGSELPAERALAAALRRDPLAPLALAGIRLEDAGETLVLHLPSWRTPRQDARSLHACVALTGAVGLVALAFDAVLAVMIAPFLIQAWHAALRNALWRARIVLQRSGIEVEAGWLRPAASALALSADLAAEVEGALSLSDRAHVRLRGAGGGAVELARGLPRAAAECLAVLLEAYLRRRRPPAQVRADAARNAQSTNN